MSEFFLFLPQMRLPMDAVVERARAAEAAGFTGIAFMDHLAPPLAESHPMHEAMTTATWVAAHTERLVVGHLVLCDALRHPAVLARQAVTLDNASGGRFELGLGFGSVPGELVSFGVGDDPPPARVARLGESLDVISALWRGEAVDYDGEYFQLHQAQQQPVPLDRIPIVIGGSGPKTLGLVRAHADWWNLQVNHLDRLEALSDQVGSARISIQHMVAFVSDPDRRDEVTAMATRRFGGMGDGLVIGDGPELVERYRDLAGRGVERFYVWFSDFAPVATLAAFGATVIAAG